ncbi:MAG: hypothetical protein AAFV53_24840 [Myxococcota bacterium]
MTLTMVCLLQASAYAGDDEQQLLDAEVLIEDESVDPILIDLGGPVDQWSRHEIQNLTRQLGELQGLTLPEAAALALRRPGLSFDPLTVRQRTRTMALLPTVQLSAQHRLRVTTQTDPQKPLRVLDESRWGVRVGVCFGACAALTQTADVPELAVVGGQVFVADEQLTGYAPTAARVASQLSATRANTLESVVALMRIRARILGEPTPQSIADVVERAIRLEENAAYLDIFTEGGFSAALTSRQE